MLVSSDTTHSSGSIPPINLAQVKEKLVAAGQPVVFEHSRWEGFKAYSGKADLQTLGTYVAAAVTALTFKDGAEENSTTAKGMELRFF